MLAKKRGYFSGSFWENNFFLVDLYMARLVSLIYDAFCAPQILAKSAPKKRVNRDISDFATKVRKSSVNCIDVNHEQWLVHLGLSFFLLLAKCNGVHWLTTRSHDLLLQTRVKLSSYYEMVGLLAVWELTVLHNIDHLELSILLKYW